MDKRGRTALAHRRPARDRGRDIPSGSSRRRALARGLQLLVLLPAASAASVLAACGRKGDLEPPPKAAGSNEGEGNGS